MLPTANDTFEPDEVNFVEYLSSNSIVEILDINLKNESGLDVLHQILPFLAKPKIIVVSMMSEYSNVSVRIYSLI